MSAYERPNPTFNETLTLVGRGTPMGELLRRYWHPVGLSTDATDIPRQIRVLGEDLILFRDGQGRAGLLYPRCIHRGASLFYGRVEEDGIRCCYHGWKFTVDGRCIDQPCEPDNGAKTCRLVRQPYYPLKELYGLIFAYMGPPEKQPVLPRYDVLENLEPGEFVEADANSIGSGGPVMVPCNWLQHFENVMDPFHVPILHGSFSGNQFTAKMAVMPKVKFEYTARGTRSIQLRDVEGGVHRRKKSVRQHVHRVRLKQAVADEHVIPGGASSDPAECKPALHIAHGEVRAVPQRSNQVLARDYARLGGARHFFFV